MSLRSVPYEGIEIEYELTRKDVKYINLRVTKTGEVTVSAGKRVPLRVIDEFVQSKALWIITHVAEIEKIRHSLPSSGIYEGKTVYYLGKAYRLSLSQGETAVTLKGDTLSMSSPQTTENALQEEYLGWMQEEAKEKFEEIMNKIHPLVAPYQVNRPVIKVRDMESRWGSCTIGGDSIRLNTRLMKAAEDCIEMVVLHELVHFLYPNHDQEFYNQLDCLMPDWKERKNRLETKYLDGI